MDCPNCGSRMLAGTFKVDNTFWRFLLTGWSWQGLFFRPGQPADGQSKSEVLGPGYERQGWRCEECGTSVLGQLIRTQRREDG